MKRTVVMLTLVLVLGIIVGMSANHVLNAQQEPVKRTVLLKTDLAEMAGKEAVMLIVEVAPGATVPKHYHPGHELGYLLEGALTLEIEGKPVVTFKQGETFDIAPKLVHSGKNASATAPAKVLVFGVFEKGQPDTTPVR